MDRKFVFFNAFISIASSLPIYRTFSSQRYGNPDEWGSYYEGDIKDPTFPFSRNGLIDEKYRWPNGQVAFSYDLEFDAAKKAIVERAMASYENLTSSCITFIPRTTEVNYILFTDLEYDGCYSSVGMQGNQQIINYPQWCIDQFGSVQHEMYHALGFYHEHSRTDRDDYINIHWNNIENNAYGNFAKYNNFTVTAFGQPYDYGSVMHYSEYAFSKDGLRTIVTVVPSAQSVIGQRVGLSQIDVNKLMLMYDCQLIVRQHGAKTIEN